MNDIDSILNGAGERWRAAQPDPPTVDAAVLERAVAPARPGRSVMVAAVGLAAVVIVGVVAARGGLPGTGPIQGSGGRAACDVTRPVPVFTPPKPYLTVPPAPDRSWYGSEALWVMLANDGEAWGHAPGHPEAPVTQKLFWWSARWEPDVELQPDITVTAVRLDGRGQFTAGYPGTNASGDFGTAMLVGADFESDGCWQITGEYRGASLSYVVWVGPDGP